MRINKRRQILVITPAFSGGSWICIEKILEMLLARGIKIRAVGLGKVFNKNDGIKYISIPFPRYDRWGFVTSAHPAVAFLWNLPLLLVGTTALMIYHPDMIISNGFAAGLTIGPLCRMLGKKLVVMYHGYIGGYLGKLDTRIVKILEKNTDLVVVNSEDSYEDIRHIVSEEKIAINEHFADGLFFEKPPKRKKGAPFTILYVGRIDRDKLCYPLIRLASDLKGDSRFSFIFAGVGEYASQIRSMAGDSATIKYLGYIENRERLRDLYRESDLVWSFADENYLALSAVEALACGTPVILPKIAALPEKTARKIEVNSRLVPEDIGWLVNPDNPEEIRRIICEIRDMGISGEMRNRCREHAKLHYSPDNLLSTVKRIYSCLCSS